MTDFEVKTKVGVNILDYSASLSKFSLTNAEDESNIIIVGDSMSGKSTVFNLLFSNKREKDPTSYSQTCGINYNFFTAQISGYKRLLVNGYEIGGGIESVGLLKNIVNDSNIRKSVIILTIDLSKPQKFLSTFKKYIEAISSVLTETCRQETLVEIINQKKQQYKNQQDTKVSSIFPSQLLLIGTKYDGFEKIDVEKVKWTCRVLRFFSNFIGASILFNRITDDKLQKSIENLIKSCLDEAFTELKPSLIQKDHLQPLFIQFGKDSYEEVGDPKVLNSNKSNPVMLWEDTFNGMYKNQMDDTESSAFDEQTLLKKYVEKSLDSELQSFEKQAVRVNDGFDAGVKKKKKR